MPSQFEQSAATERANTVKESARYKAEREERLRKRNLLRSFQAMCIPLCRLSVPNLCAAIDFWVRSDPEYTVEQEPSLEALTSRLKEEAVDGTKYIAERQRVRKLIKTVTEWEHAFLAQLDLFLCRRWSASPRVFAQQMKRVLRDNEQALAAAVVSAMRGALSSHKDLDSQ